MDELSLQGASSLQQAMVRRDVSVAVANKVNGAIEQSGQAALALLQATLKNAPTPTSVTPPEGGAKATIDLVA